MKIGYPSAIAHDTMEGGAAARMGSFRAKTIIILGTLIRFCSPTVLEVQAVETSPTKYGDPT